MYLVSFSGVNVLNSEKYVLLYRASLVVCEGDSLCLDEFSPDSSDISHDTRKPVFGISTGLT